jgi:hypothetical protein
MLDEAPPLMLHLGIARLGYVEKERLTVTSAPNTVASFSALPIQMLLSSCRSKLRYLLSL